MFDLYHAFEHTVSETRDPDHEPFFAQYCEAYRELNRIAMSTGELVEGSLFNDMPPASCRIGLFLTFDTGGETS